MWRPKGWLARTAADHLLARRGLVWSGVLLVGAIVCTQMPLFNVLGYEFAFAMAIAGSIAALDLGRSFVARVRRGEAAPIERAVTPGRLIARLCAASVSIALLTLLLPLVLLLLSALFVRNCDLAFGLWAFAAVTMLSTAMASVVGLLSGLLVPGRRFLSPALPYLVFVTAVLAALYRFYSEPAVFSYSLFAGYFPGNLYDIDISLTRAFWWARLHQLALLALGLSLAAIFLDLRRLRLGWRRTPTGLRPFPMVSAALAAPIFTVLHLSGGSLGFAVDAEDVRAALPRTVRTKHFVIRLPGDPSIARHADAIAEDHEFRRAQLVRDLRVDPSSTVESYYFASPDEKHALIGAKRVYMAKPWRQEIYLNHYPFPHQVLRHEIAHVIAAEFGDPIFNVSAKSVLGLPLAFNVGLIEGIAVATDWPDHFTRELTPHQSVKAMLELEMAPPLDAILSTGFLAFSSARSYTLAGSFVRFLLDRYGARPLRILYQSGGDFERAYGVSQKALAQEWLQMIESIELPAGAAEVVRERFRQPSIFERPCPRAIARAQIRAIELERAGEPEEAVLRMRRVCRTVPGEPTYLLQLADLLARTGQNDEAQKTYLELADREEDLSSTVRAMALFGAAADAYRAGDRDRTRQLLRRADAMPLEESLRRNVVAQLYVLDHAGAGGPALRDYFWGDDPSAPTDSAVALARAAEAAHLEPENAFAHYLVGRQLGGRGDPAATNRALVRALERGVPHVTIERECARLLAESAYLAQDTGAVKRAAAILIRPEQPLVMQLYGYDWLERLHYRETGEVPNPPLGPPRTPPASP